MARRDDDTEISEESYLDEYLFSDPEYRAYSDVLHGTYIAALMQRAKNVTSNVRKGSRKKRDSATTSVESQSSESEPDDSDFGHADSSGPEESEEPSEQPSAEGSRHIKGAPRAESHHSAREVSASTLSKKARAAFRDEQDKLTWKHEDAVAATGAALEKRAPISQPAKDDRGTEPQDSDFASLDAIDAPAEIPSIDSDFGDAPRM